MGDKLDLKLSHDDSSHGIRGAKGRSLSRGNMGRFQLWLTGKCVGNTRHAWKSLLNEQMNGFRDLSLGSRT